MCHGILYGMSKKLGNIFEEIYSTDNIYAAYRHCRKGKRFHHRQLYFQHELNQNIFSIQEDLKELTYSTGGYYTFWVREPKKRTIASLKRFRDRVVQRAIIQKIEPFIDNKFIYDSFACRKGKGTHRCMGRTQEFLQDCLRKHGKIYCLKADVEKYFASIDHDILKKLLRRNIKDKRLLHILDGIIDSYHSNRGKNKGVPIGNLTSQLFANMTLNALDQYIKSELGVKWYVRYLDDFVIVHHDKESLRNLLGQINQFLSEELNLTLNKSTQVFPVRHKGGRGLEFLGVKMWPDGRRLKKDSVNRLRRRVENMYTDYHNFEIDLPEIYEKVASFRNHVKYADGMYLLSHLLRGRNFYRYEHDRPKSKRRIRPDPPRVELRIPNPTHRRAA